MADTKQIFTTGVRGGAYHEDVLDEIFQIDDALAVTPFYDSIGDSSARSVWHDWGRRSLDLRSDNAQHEGAVYNNTTFANTTLASRVSNWCQIFGRFPRVTGTQEAMDPVGIANLLADQVEYQQIGIKTDMELALVQGTLNSGPTNQADTVARRLQGAIAAATFTTTFTTAATFNENLFNDAQERGWDRGARLRDILVGGRVKRWISTFTASSTKYIFSEDKRVVNAVDVYESDFYITRIRLSHDIPSVAPPTVPRRALLMYDRDMYSKAWLRRPSRRALSRGTDAEEVELLSEMTLEFGHPGASTYLAGFARDGNGI
jgi:hypothetical protein